MSNEFQKADNGKPTQTEVWKDIPGYEGYYQVSNFGRVKRLARYVDRHAYGIVHKKFYRERIIKNSLVHGYPVVNLCKENFVKHFQIHRIVAQTFIPNPLNKEQVNHKNGIRNDNRVENLEWVTNTENQRHSFQVLGRVSGRKGKPMTDKMRAGLKRYQKEHYEDLCRKVRCIELNRVFVGITNACKELGVSKHISDCCKGKRERAGGYHWEYVND
jgi:hypothetical protein